MARLSCHPEHRCFGKQSKDVRVHTWKKRLASESQKECWAEPVPGHSLSEEYTETTDMQKNESRVKHVGCSERDN